MQMENRERLHAVRPQVVIGGAFDLVDHHGRAVTAASYVGRHALLFFGFTHCRRVCPETLGRISTALDRLGEEAERIQPLYISVDPARDTPEVMRRFLVDRYPRFTGLTGDEEAVAAMKRAYKVYAEREEAGADGSYDVPHTAMVFVVGPDGGYLTHFPDSVSVDEIVQGLAAILGEPVDLTGRGPSGGDTVPGLPTA